MLLRVFPLCLLTLLIACDSRPHSERAAIQFEYAPYESMPFQTFLGDYNDRLQSHAPIRDSANCLSGWSLHFGENEIQINVGLHAGNFDNGAIAQSVCDSAHNWQLDQVRRFSVRTFEVVDLRRDKIIYLTNTAPAKP